MRLGTTAQVVNVFHLRGQTQLGLVVRFYLHPGRIQPLLISWDIVGIKHKNTI